MSVRKNKKKRNSSETSRKAIPIKNNNHIVLSLKSKWNWIIIFCLFTLLVDTIIFSFPQMFYKDAVFPVRITSLKEKNSNSKGYEIWVNPLGSEKEISSDPGWVKKNGGYFCNTPDQSIVFQYNSFNSKDIQLSKHTYAAAIRVTYLNHTKDIDLYQSTEKIESITLDTNPTRNSFYEILKNVAIITGLSILILFCTLYFLPTVADVGFLLAVFCSIVIRLYDTLGVLHFCLFIAISSVAYACLRHSKYVCVTPYLSRPILAVFIIFISVYSGFAFAGYNIFLSGDFVNSSPVRIVDFICLSALMIPLVLVAIQIFERIAQKCVNRRQNEQSLLYFQIISFILTASILVVACLVFYPANFTPDNVDQWLQALGYYPINDAHPAIHTLIQRLCSKIYPSPVVFTILQALLFSYVCTKITSVLYRKGCNKRVLLCVLTVIAILPSTIALITCTTKNVLFAILLLWLIYLFIETFEGPESFFRRPGLVAQFIIVFPMLCIIRHNDFVVVPIVIAYFIVLTVKYFRQIKWKAVLCLALSLVVYKGITGPLYQHFHVIQDVSLNQSVSDALVMPFIPALKEGIALPDDTMVYLKKILPVEEYVKRYQPYNGDVFAWSSPTPNVSKVTLREMLTQYLKLLRYRPDIVIKSRLDGTNLIWDVYSHPNVSHARYAMGICGSNSPDYLHYYEEDPRTFIPERKVKDGVYGVGNGPAHFLSAYVGILNNTVVLDSVVWRNGIYVILMLLILVMALQHKTKRIYVLLLLPFSILFTLILVIAWQIYQYVWFFPLSILAIFAYLLTCIHKPEEQICKSEKAVHKKTKTTSTSKRKSVAFQLSHDKMSQ